MRVQRVVLPEGQGVSWTVLGADHTPIEPIESWLSHLSNVGRSPNTQRAYATDVRDYFLFLDQRQIGWREPSVEVLGEWAAWLRSPLGAGGTVLAFGSRLPRCGPATVSRKLSAVSAFYEFHARHGLDVGRLRPMWQAWDGRRSGGSWKPFLTDIGPSRQRRRQIPVRVPKREPRLRTAAEVQGLLDACERLRDRFLIALLYSTGIRIGEALGARHEDLPVTHPHAFYGHLYRDLGGPLVNPSPVIPANQSREATPEHHMVLAGEMRFHVVTAGSGPPVVLVAGFPQSCYAWRRVMPLLAEHHTVVAVDLPGQGDSDKPAGGYDTLATARRLRELITALGLERYVLVGHDIGSWVGYAYAHEFQSEMRGLVLLDGNIPGVTLQSTLTLGPDNWRNWHFLFNPIPDLPEALLEGRERILIEWFFNRKTADWISTFSKADIDEYERVYRSPGGMRGMLGYYRAVLQDIEQNQPLMATQLDLPILALGGEVGSAPDLYERMQPLGLDVRGGVIAGSGHYIPEEKPVALTEELHSFISSLAP